MHNPAIVVELYQVNEGPRTQTVFSPSCLAFHETSSSFEDLAPKKLLSPLVCQLFGGRLVCASGPQDEGAIKWWIGNAAEDGRMATVFARLKVPQTTGASSASPPAAPGSKKLIDHGVHAFMVPLRDGQGHVLPGVEIHDCGYKASGDVHTWPAPHIAVRTVQLTVCWATPCCFHCICGLVPLGHAS